MSIKMLRLLYFQILFFLLTSDHRFKMKQSADEALAKMNGFNIAGRPIRVGLGGDRATVDARIQAERAAEAEQANTGGGFKGSAFHADRRIDRVGGTSTAFSAAALDDADVAGISYGRVDRSELMKKLLREEDGLAKQEEQLKPQPVAEPPRQSSRCIVLTNMFSADE